MSEPSPAPVTAPVPPEVLAAVLGAVPTGVSVVDARTPGLPLVHVNPAWEQLTGVRAQEALGRGPGFLQCAETDPGSVRALGEAVRTGRPTRVVLLNARPDGSRWWNELHLAPVHDADGVLTHLLGFSTDATARVEAEVRLSRLSTGPLEDLPHRGRLVESLERELATPGGPGRTAVLFCDVSAWAARSGRATLGGPVLAAVAARLRAALRRSDLLVHCGGGLFLALLCDLPAGADEVSARAAAAVRGALDEPVAADGQLFPVDGAVGVLVHPVGASAADVLGAVDRAVALARATTPR